MFNEIGVGISRNVVFAFSIFDCGIFWERFQMLTNLKLEKRAL